jgi:cellulose biosynthesis protein BcsQ
VSTPDTPTEAPALSRCRFDDSLERMLQVLCDELGRDEVAKGWVLRDATGCLSYFSHAPLSENFASSVASKLRAALGPYARPDRVLAGPDDPSAAIVDDDPATATLRLPVTDSAGSSAAIDVRVLDRRIVGADWVRQPELSAEPPAGAAKRIAFASLKGGVGRSTALTVVAAEQARKGRNVLVIDLDLEAPGLGSLLLRQEDVPRFGVIDYLVERNFEVPDSAFVHDMVGNSTLTQGQGQVDVVPAVGTRTKEEPRNYLAKLSRAMLEAIDESGEPVSPAGKLREMLTQLEQRRRYDLVLLDVRSGLAELTAGPLLALDAEILLFGTAQLQTEQDLHYLFAALATLTGDEGAVRWRRLKMVHAKAREAAAVAAFRDRLWNLFLEHLYEEDNDLEAFSFDADIPDAPHYPIVIPLDSAFADWDPANEPTKLIAAYYERTFGELVAYVDDLLSPERDAED